MHSLVTVGNNTVVYTFFFPFSHQLFIFPIINSHLGFFFCFVLFFVFFLFLGLLPRHMEVPRLGVQSEP